MKKKNKNNDITRYDIGYGFHLGLSIRDLDLVNFIQNKLEKGKILIYPDEAHYYITQKQELINFLEEISKYSLLTSYQYNCYINLYNTLKSGKKSVITIEDFNNLCRNTNYTVNPLALCALKTHDHINN